MAIDTQEIIREDALLEKLIAAREQILSEVRKVIIAQDEVVDQALISLFVGGHSPVTSECPPTNNDMSAWSTTSSCAMMTLRTSLNICSRAAISFSSSASS